MNKATTAAVLATAILACTTPVRAQVASGAGLGLAAGAGPGWVRVSCDICQTSRDLGPSAFVRVSTSVRPGVLVGAEAVAWTHEIEDEREKLGAALAVLYVHPRQGPFYVKGGIGYVGYRAGDIALNAAGVEVGAGYELRLGGVALTNHLNLIASSFGSLKNGSTTIAEAVSTTLLQLGVGLTLR